MTALIRSLLPEARTTFQPITFDDWASMFQLGNFPLQLNQTLQGNREQIEQTFSGLVNGAYRSNAIVFAHGEATVGIGGGQPNRVDCVRLAAERAGEQARGAVMASDAFFPFPDSVELAAQAGITAVVHPGGSVRDAETVAAADAAGMALVTTGTRHFRH